MTKGEFNGLPFLLFSHEVCEVLGYRQNTMRKMVECEVLQTVLLPGCQAKFRKVQVAQLAGLEEWLAPELEAFRHEPLLLGLKAVMRWVGYSKSRVPILVRAAKWQVVQPPGQRYRRFRKVDVARVIGLEHYV